MEDKYSKVFRICGDIDQIIRKITEEYDLPLIMKNAHPIRVSLCMGKLEDNFKQQTYGIQSMTKLTRDVMKKI